MWSGVGENSFGGGVDACGEVGVCLIGVEGGGDFVVKVVRFIGVAEV